MAGTTTREDVVTFLTRQHKEIRTLFTKLEQAKGDDRRDTFRELVRLLAVHEAAEEELVHPDVRRFAGGEPVVKARIGEEHSAKELLANMYDMGPDAEGFDTLLTQLRDDVLAHAEHEEREEFHCSARSTTMTDSGRWPSGPGRPRPSHPRGLIQAWRARRRT